MLMSSPTSAWRSNRNSNCSKSRRRDRRWRGEEVARRVPEQVTVLAVARTVRGMRQDDELAVAIRKLLIEIDQILGGRVAVPDAADHQHGRGHLLRIHP